MKTKSKQSLRLRETARRQRIARALKRLWRLPGRRARMARIMTRQWRNPMYRRLRVEGARGQWRDATTRRRMSAAMKRRWRDPAHRRKMIRALRRGWQDPVRRARRAAVARRNLGPSIGAQTLLAALGAGWVLECWTPAGSVDVAHPEMRMAIEVDDIGHRRPVAKLRDRRKERRLRRLGWTVFRVSEAGCRAAFCETGRGK